MVQPLWKMVWQCLKKLKVESPYGPSFLLLAISLKEWKAGIPAEMYIPVFFAASLTKAKRWK